MGRSHQFDARDWFVWPARSGPDGPVRRPCRVQRVITKLDGEAVYAVPPSVTESTARRTGKSLLCRPDHDSEVAFLPAVYVNDLVEPVLVVIVTTTVELRRLPPFAPFRSMDTFAVALFLPEVLLFS
jgi:hypothetical protein